MAKGQCLKVAVFPTAICLDVVHQRENHVHGRIGAVSWRGPPWAGILPGQNGDGDHVLIWSAYGDAISYGLSNNHLL